MTYHLTKKFKGEVYFLRAFGCGRTKKGDIFLKHRLWTKDVLKARVFDDLGHIKIVKEDIPWLRECATHVEYP